MKFRAETFLPRIGVRVKKEIHHLGVSHHCRRVERSPAGPGLLVGQPGGVPQDDLHHGVVTLAGGAVQDREAVLVLVQQAGSHREEGGHHRLVTLLDGTTEGTGAVLAPGVHVLPHLHQELHNLLEAGYGGVVEGAVPELVSLYRTA